jgi:hypothetical protein
MRILCSSCASGALWGVDMTDLHAGIISLALAPIGSPATGTRDP